MEIQSVLRDVCDEVLGDRKIDGKKRVERAQALLLMGECFVAARRDPEEEGEFMMFERLMAEAGVKREKEDKKKKERVEKERVKAEEKAKKAAMGVQAEADAKISGDGHAKGGLPERHRKFGFGSSSG